MISSYLLARTILLLGLSIHLSSSAIIDCVQGYYHDDTGTCIACPTGTSYVSGSDFCICAPGKHFDVNGDCVDCPDGASSDGSNTGSPERDCRPCLAGQKSDAGNGHICTDGSTIMARRKAAMLRVESLCLDCVAKTFSLTCGEGYHPVSGLCAPCPAGTTSDAKTWTDGSSYACTPCGYGKYSDATFKCILCTGNTYSDAETGQAACRACPTGSVAEAVQHKYCDCAAGKYFTATACVPCLDGTYSAASKTDAKVTQCTPCPTPGYVSDTANGHVCTLCAGNTYNTVSMGQATCVGCPSGTLENGDHTDCICAAGSHFNAGGSCVQCGDGKGTSAISTVTSKALVDSCIPCKAGFVSNLDNLHVCTECPINTFSNAVGSSSCTSCPSGTTASAIGSTYCVCPAGNYFNAAGACVACADGYSAVESTTATKVTACTACSVGYKSNPGNGHVCESCTAGTTYNDIAKGQADCYACPLITDVAKNKISYCVCIEGKYFDTTVAPWTCSFCGVGTTAAESTTTNPVTSCTPCSVGYKSNSGTDFKCIKCSTANTYSSLTTTLANCYSCPGSSWNSAGGSYCKCNAGYYFDSSNYCVACPIGKSSLASTTDNMLKTCTACDVGYESNVGTSHLCMACATDTYNDNPTVQSSCVICPGSSWSNAGSGFCTCNAGYYFSSATNCENCPAGMSSEASTTLSKNTACTPCSLGYMSNLGTSYLCVQCTTDNTYNDAAKGQADCYPCPGASWNFGGGTFCNCNAGYYFNPGGDCVACTAGTSSAASNTLIKVTSCSVCAAGYISTFGTSYLCEACPTNTYNTGTGLTICTPCPAGTSNSGGANTYCTCPAGYYFSTATTCVACASGTSTLASTTASSITSCTSCSPGKYSNPSTNYICTPCPTGTYTDSGTGYASCQDCAAHHTNTGTGNPNCWIPPCAPGNYADATAICQPCAAGTYQNLGSQTSCPACPAHSSSTTIGTILCTCENHYYYDSTQATNYCQECDNYCYRCSGTATSCLECEVGNSGLVYTSATQTCSCRLTEGYMEVTSLGITSCIPCGICPYDGRLLSVTLDEEWTKITLLFNSNVYVPLGIADGTAALCDYLFYTSLFGTGYSCGISGPRLTVLLGENAMFYANSQLVPKSGVLKIPPCTCGYDVAIGVTSVVPFVLSASVAPITSPHLACQELTIQLGSFQGLGKRPGTLSVAYSIFSVISTNPYPRLSTLAKSKAMLNACFKSQTGTKLIIPANLMVDAALYTLQYVMTNFGSTGTYSVNFMTANYGTPTLSLAEGAVLKSIYEWDPLVITPLFTYPGCEPANVGLSYMYNWSQSDWESVDHFDEAGLSEAYSPKDGIVEFPAHTFLPERNFVFFLNASHLDYPVFFCTHITIHVIRSEVIARISNGDRTIASSDLLVLDGTTSADNTNQPGSVTYYWTCENRTTTVSSSICVCKNGSLAGFDPGLGTLKFKTGVFWSPSTMVWNLRVTKGDIYDSTYVKIKVVDVQYLAVGVKTAKESLKVNRNKATILSAAAYSQYPYNLTYLWTSDPALPSQSFATGLRDKFLKINAFALDEDERYNFTCQIQDPEGNVGNSSIRVIVNRAPRYGSLNVSPSRGVSAGTVFEVKATGWYDDDVPLTYVFSYQDPGTGVFYPLGTRSEASGMNTTLGIGTIVVGDTVTILVKVEVFDALNASSSAYSSATLAPSDVNGTSLLQSLSTATTSLEKLHLLSLAGKLLNCNTSSQSCTDTLYYLRILELDIMPSLGPETEDAVLDVLNSVSLPSESESLALKVNILADIALREVKAIEQALSVADAQLENKAVKSGLSADTVRTILGVLGNTTALMSSAQLQQNQESILAVADMAGRSLLKDAVPNETSIVAMTKGVTVFGKKLAACSEDYKFEDEVQGVNFSFPVCEILPVGQSTFEKKTLNKVTPYDLIIQVFEQNVMGDCVPLSSKMIRVVIYDDENKVIYKASGGYPSGIKFKFQLDDKAFPEDELVNVACTYYSEGDTDFVSSTVGTEIVDAGKRLFQCTTRHLSEFALKYNPSFRPKGYIDAEFWLLLLLFLVCTSMHIWAAKYDAKLQIDSVKDLQEKTYEAACRLVRFYMRTAERGNGLPAPDPQDPGHETTVAAYMPFGRLSNTGLVQTERMDKTRVESMKKAANVTNLHWTKLLALVVLRTHSLLRVFIYPTGTISRKACTQIFWNGFFVRIFFLTLYSQLMSKMFSWWALVLLAYFTATPVCLVIELAMRATVKISRLKDLPRTEKVGILQAAIYARLRLQGRLRALARVVSYSIPVLSFVATNLMYRWNHCSSVDNVLFIIELLLYILLIQDLVLNPGLQFLAIYTAGTHRGSMARKIVLKEVKEILWNRSDGRVVPTKLRTTPTADVLRSINSFTCRPEIAGAAAETHNGRRVPGEARYSTGDNNPSQADSQLNNGEEGEAKGRVAIRKVFVRRKSVEHTEEEQDDDSPSKEMVDEDKNEMSAEEAAEVEDMQEKEEEDPRARSMMAARRYRTENAGEEGEDASWQPGSAK